jgi:hypothetical protein
MTRHAETHPAATAYQIKQALGLPTTTSLHVGTTLDGQIVLTNAVARRLLALAEAALEMVPR